MGLESCSRHNCWLSGTVCHRRLHQRCHWTPFAGVWRLICSPCHIRTYNYRNWL